MSNIIIVIMACSNLHNVCELNREECLQSWIQERENSGFRGPSTLTWELWTGESKTTLEDKTKIGNGTYYISSESPGDAESE